MSLFQWLTRGVLLLGAITTLRGVHAGMPEWFTPWAVASATVALERMRIPMFSTLYRATMLIGVISVVAPAPASAQLGRLVKKAKAAAGVDKPAVEAAETTRSGGTDRGISVATSDRITEPVLDQFVISLEAERTLLAQQVAERKAMKTPEQYGECYHGLIIGNPEAKRLMDQFDKESQGASDQAMMRAAEKLAAELKLLSIKVCGSDPSQHPRIDDPEVRSARTKDAAAAGNLERRKYALLKERIIPLCALDDADVSGGDLSIPGDGANYVYLASEVEIVRSRCGALMPALQAVG